MNPELAFAALVLWSHTIRDVLQDAKRRHRWLDWFVWGLHFKDNHWSELPTAMVTAALGTLVLCYALI